MGVLALFRVEWWDIFFSGNKNRLLTLMVFVIAIGVSTIMEVITDWGYEQGIDRLQIIYLIVYIPAFITWIVTCLFGCIVKKKLRSIAHTSNVVEWNDRIENARKKMAISTIPYGAIAVISFAPGNKTYI